MQLNKIIVLSFALFGNAFATELQPAGTVDYFIKPTEKNTQLTLPKKIKLLNFKLSSNAVDSLKQKTHLIHQSPTLTATSRTTHEKQLGMNGVPVLDQGNFGTCVTFADTAAIDAVLGKGDYISQLCLLQLGNYASIHAYSYSGWDGSLSRSILNRIEDHGFISKDIQRVTGCGELTEYPSNNSPIPKSAISFDDYHQLSDGLTNHGIYWTTILDSYKAFFLNEVDTQNLVTDIKKSIDNGHRVTIATFLPAVDLGLAGAVGKHHVENDTWVLSTIIERELYLSTSLFFAGHAMVITGYDDNAVAIDDLGREHVGLFTLRNSWGEHLGDKGDFYMSYDYFKVLGFEAQQIIKDDFFDEDQNNDEPDDDSDDEDE
jgi:hypothetical protein